MLNFESRFIANAKLFAIGLLACYCLGMAIAEKLCTDMKGRNISAGSDPCTQCTCNNGTQRMCLAFYCPPPEKCRQNPKLNDKCCEFLCMGVSGENIGKDADSLTPTNLGLRLVASAVTSFLILALLLFMIHRLRQRRLLLVIRQQIAGLNAHRLDSVSHGGQHYSNDDEGNVGYFVGHEQLEFGSYDEPPPPYSFWKPSETYVPTGEAPPPYEVTIRYPPPSISVSPTIGAQQQGRLFPRPDHATDSRSPSTGVGTQVLLGLSLVADRGSSLDGRASCRSSQVSPGVFSTNERGESTCSSDINFSRGAILESDALYEDPPLNGATVSHLNGGIASQSTSNNLREEDIANGNVLLGTPGVESSSASSSLGRGGRGSGSNKSRDSRTGNRCHSYCEGLGQWRAEQTNQKQTVIGGSNNNIVPDPTAWIGDTTDTSTSSSPSSEQQTVSPSSSETSGETYSRNQQPDSLRKSSYAEKSIDRPKQKLINYSSGKSSEGGNQKKMASVNVKEKRNSLERTLKQLKRFSLPSKKKISETTSPSCSKVSSSSALPRLPSLGRDSRSGNRNSAASVSESSCSSGASPEALDENRTKLIPEESSGKFQQGKCKRVWHRPASLNLNSYYLSNPPPLPRGNNANFKSNHRQSSEPSPKCSTSSGESGGLSLASAFHHLQRSVTPRESYDAFSPPSRGGHDLISRPPPLHLMENRPQIVTPETDSSENAALQRRTAIARSSSICSETGERNPRRLSLNITHSRVRHGSDSTPENGINSNSSSAGSDHHRLDNLRLPANRFRHSCSSESNNSSS